MTKSVQLGKRPIEKKEARTVAPAVVAPVAPPSVDDVPKDKSAFGSTAADGVAPAQVDPAGLRGRVKVALAYARHGKPRLAARVLAEAEYEATSKNAPKAVRAEIDKAQKAIASLAKTIPADPGESQKKRTVLLYGLSANPPTGLGGHAGIVKWGASDLEANVPNEADPSKAVEGLSMDEVWVLPVFRHMFSSKQNLASFEDRTAMAKLAFENIPGAEGRVHVEDVERVVAEQALETAKKNGQKPEDVHVGTIDIIRHLTEKHPDTQFVLALGGDTYMDLKGGKWKEGDTLQRTLPIAVIPRVGVEPYGWEETVPGLTDISSTKVRGSTDREFLEGALQPQVLDYIVEHKLFGFAPPEGSDEKKP